MSSWNNRVIKHTYTHQDGTTEDWFGVHEVFYNKEGQILYFTEDPVAPNGETYEDLIKDIEQMLADAKKAPVLVEGEIECVEDNFDEDAFVDDEDDITSSDLLMQDIGM